MDVTGIFKIKIKIEIRENIPNISNDYNNTIATVKTAGVLFPAGVRDFSLLHAFQTGAHQTSYPMGTGGFSPEGKTAGA
jgi:hypothetical protein